MARYVSFVALALLVAVGAEAQTSSPSARPEQVVVRFQPGAILSGPVGAGGPQDFQFRSLGTGPLMNQAGVVALERLFPGFTEASVLSRNLLGEEILLDDLSQVYVARLRAGHDRARAAGVLRRSEDVLWADPDDEIQAYLTPNDPLFGLQWWAHDTGQIYCSTYDMVGDTDVNAPAAWDITTGSNPVRVGILDTGIQSNHPDLGNRVVLGATFVPGTPNASDDEGHGTACAGIVGATGNNGIGVAGVAWGSVPVAVKVLDSGGGGQWSWLAQGLDWARVQNDIPIINLSLGGSSLDATVRAACKNAFLSGQFLATAMGNGNTTSPSYPAAFPVSNFAVGALYNGSRWTDANVGGCFAGRGLGSNMGSWIDVAAPGGAMIATTKLGSGYYDFDPCSCTPYPDAFGGTSAATPVVAGVAALLRSRYPTLLGEDIEQILIRSADDVTAPGVGWDSHTGYGLVRADEALDFLADPRQIYQTQISSFSNLGYVNVGAMSFFGVPGMADGVYYPRRYRLRGTVTFGPSYLVPPDVWVRRSGTIGVSFSNPYNEPVEFPYAEIVPGSVSATACQVDVFVYEIFNVQGAFVQWYPTQPSGARAAITAIGPARDLTPPAAITNLQFNAAGRMTSGTLSWTAQGDDGSTGTATSFDLRYSNAPINAGNFGSATPWPAPTPGPAGTPHVLEVGGLTSCTPYYWAIKSIDESNNVSGLSNIASATTSCDSIPPAAVSDLLFVPGRTTGIVAWTAPGDDGNSGQAAEYDLRYSNVPIHDGNFASCPEWPTEPPQEAGMSECVSLSGLGTCDAYHWALKTRDDNGNWSAISNVSYGSTCNKKLMIACAGQQAAMQPVPEGTPTLPVELSIGAPAPNPTSTNTSLTLAIPAAFDGAPLRVAVFDLGGRRVRTLRDGRTEAGHTRLTWDLRAEDGTRVRAGVYYLRATVGDRTETRKLLLVR